MSSIRFKITLLFLLVTTPLVLEMLYQNGLAGGLAAVVRTAHHADLTLAKELTALERVSRESSQPNMLKESGEIQGFLAELQSISNRLAQMRPIERETKPLRQAIQNLVRAVSPGSSLTLQHVQRLQVIVAAEIRNLLITLELRSQKRSSELESQFADLRSTALWSAILLLSLGGIVTWVFTGRYTSQLHTLTREIQKLSHAASGRPSGEDEVAEVAHAFCDLYDTITHSMVDRQYFEDLLNSMSECVLVSDLMGKLVYVNAAARKLFDRESAGIVGQDASSYINLSWTGIDTRGDAWYDGLLHRYDDGSPHVFARRTHLIGDSGALQGTVYVIQDITESKDLIRANLAYRDRLSRSERLASFGTLGAIVAHKFSQPLSTVRLFLQQIQRELAPASVSETVRSNLTESLAELGRIAEITKQMVASGKTTATQTEGQHAEVSTAVERVFESLSEAARRRNVSLHNLCTDAGDAVACTSFELEEILYCLINNSIHAAPDDRPTQVTVSTERQGIQTTIVVCDTGRGMAPEHLDKIFEWCFTTKPEGQGTGLGLAIVRSIIEQHGGRIAVVSEERIGSRFSIMLPIAAEVNDDSSTECLYC